MEICSIAVDHMLSLLAQTMDRLDKAASHFEDALAYCRKAGYRPELAWTCCDYADALRERNGEGERARAVSLLDESLATSSELGMRPLMDRMLSRRGNTGGAGRLRPVAISRLGDPSPVLALNGAIQNADGVILAIPEYDYGTSGALKNGR